MKKLVLIAALAGAVGVATAGQPILNTFCTDYRHYMIQSCEKLDGSVEFCSDDKNILNFVDELGGPDAACQMTGAEGADKDQCVASFNQYVNDCVADDA